LPAPVHAEQFLNLAVTYPEIRLWMSFIICEPIFLFGMPFSSKLGINL
jgi:hypothetical protein